MRMANVGLTLFALGACACGDDAHQQSSDAAVDAAEPDAAVPFAKLTSIDVAQGHACAVRDDGTLWCWGENTDGEVGDGTQVPRAAPTQIGTAAIWRQVTTGYN